MPFVDHPQGNSTSIEWQCYQVYNSINPDDIKVGTRLAICEHAMRSCLRASLPRNTRFIEGTVVRVYGSEKDPIMEIEFAKPIPQNYGLGMHCGIKQYARFCISLPEKPKPPKPEAPLRGLTVWEQLMTDE